MTKACDLTGMTGQACPIACNPIDGCTITGSICGHPFKGGLQGALQNNPQIIANYQRARGMLLGKRLDVSDDAIREVADKPKKAAKAKRKTKRSKGAKPAAKPPADAPEAPVS